LFGDGAFPLYVAGFPARETKENSQLRMSSDLLVELLQELDAPQARICELERYATGHQALAFLSPEAKQALGTRLGRMVSNIPKLAVTALSERIRILGFTGVDISAEWRTNDLDELSAAAIRESLLFGNSFVIVWADSAGRPLVTVESPKQVAVIRDPATREVVSAVKRWRTKTQTHAMVYLPDRIEHHRANTAGAATAGFDLVESIDNPLGVVPVVPITNADFLLGKGCSEIDDLIPLCDALNKLLADMMVTSEYTGRPRRWATGIELTEKPVVDEDGNPVMDEDDQPVVETANPIPEGNRMMVSENETAKFGQLDAAGLNGYESGVRVILGQIMAVSALPAHMLGVLHDQVTSADALRAAEASLTARAEARQKTFGRAFEQVARLIVAVRDGVNVSDVMPQVCWADPSTRSEAQEADAVVKLVQAGILPVSWALKKMGYTDAEITEIVDGRTEEIRTGIKADIDRYTYSLGSK
jgi:hypothetical protein